MGHIIKSFGHGSFHIPHSISNRITKVLRADHPLIITFLSSGAAICTYQLNAQYSPDGIVLAALAGTSAWLLIGLAMESSNLTIMILNLLTAPLVFALAYASLSGPNYFMIAAFAALALVLANQIVGADKSVDKQVFCLTLYSASLTLLLF